MGAFLVCIWIFFAWVRVLSRAKKPFYNNPIVLKTATVTNLSIAFNEVKTTAKL